MFVVWAFFLALGTCIIFRRLLLPKLSFNCLFFNSGPGLGRVGIVELVKQSPE